MEISENLKLKRKEIESDDPFVIILEDLKKAAAREDQQDKVAEIENLYNEKPVDPQKIMNALYPLVSLKGSTEVQPLATIALIAVDVLLVQQLSAEEVTHNTIIKIQKSTVEAFYSLLPRIDKKNIEGIQPQELTMIENFKDNPFNDQGLVKEMLATLIGLIKIKEEFAVRLDYIQLKMIQASIWALKRIMDEGKTVKNYFPNVKFNQCNYFSSKVVEEASDKEVSDKEESDEENFVWKKPCKEVHAVELPTFKSESNSKKRKPKKEELETDKDELSFDLSQLSESKQARR